MALELPTLGLGAMRTDVVFWGTVGDSAKRTVEAFTQNVSPWLEIALWCPPGLASASANAVEVTAPSRALTLARVMEQGYGECLALVDLSRSPVIPARDGLAAMALALQRGGQAGLLYADHMEDGSRGPLPRRLLPYHRGRVRDDLDVGAVVMLDRARVEEIGGPSPDLRFADLYDLRLRLSERFSIQRMAAADGGYPYSCASLGPHEVFAYLLGDRAAQLEAERVLTGHLKRIGAYLAPGQNIRPRPSAVDNLHTELRASVIIPVNRRPGFTSTAVESVLAQTARDVEVIVVVNGGEADPTAAEVRKYMPGGARHRKGSPRVRLVVTDVNNIGFCLNLGLQAARGRYYVQLDSDDRLKPHAVAALTEALEADRCAGMAIGSYEVWDMEANRRSRREDLPVVKHEEWTPENGRNNLLRINGAGAPRAAPIALLEQAGWFGVGDCPGTANYGEDYDMILRLSECHRILRLYEPLYEVTRHAGGTDHAVSRDVVDQQNETKDWFRLQAIQRRQAINERDGVSPCSQVASS